MKIEIDIEDHVLKALAEELNDYYLDGEAEFRQETDGEEIAGAVKQLLLKRLEDICNLDTVERERLWTALCLVRGFGEPPRYGSRNVDPRWGER